MITRCSVSPKYTGPIAENNVELIAIAAVLTICGVVFVTVVVVATAYALYRRLRRHQVANSSNPSQNKL